MTQITHRVEDWCPAFIALAGAKLNLGKGDVLSAALRVYRDYLLRSGVLTEAETKQIGEV